MSETFDITPENYCYHADEGIVINGTTNKNCSEICTTPELLFSSSDIFTECLFIGQTGSNISDSSLSNLHASPDFNNTIISTVDAIDSCMQQYCKEPDEQLGGCPYHNITGALDAIYEDINTVYWERGKLLPRFEATGACNVLSTVNADIGGPGVSFFKGLYQREI